MWTWKQKNKNLISISLSPQYISCCWAKQCKEKKTTINAYEKKQLKSLEFEKSIIFNPTEINSQITRFIKKHAIEKPIISLCVTGPNVFEKITTLSKSCPDKEDFTSPNLKNINWSHAYLCPSIKNGFHFYIYGIAKETFFQCRLLAIKLKLPLKAIKPSIATHLQPIDRSHHK